MSDLEDAIVAAVKLAARDPDLDVRIRDRSSRWFEDTKNVTITPIGIRRLGVDESRRRVSGAERREVIHGVRVIRLQVAVDGVSHVLGETSGDIADTIVAGLESEDVRDLLAAENLSRATCGSVQIIPARGDNDDERSVAVFDLAFNTSREVIGGLLEYVATAPATPTGDLA